MVHRSGGGANIAGRVLGRHSKLYDAQLSPAEAKGDRQRRMMQRGYKLLCTLECTRSLRVRAYQGLIER